MKLTRMKKLTSLSLLIVFFVVCLVGSAWARDYLKEAKEYYQLTDYESCMKVILKGLEEGKIKPKNRGEAYYLLALASQHTFFSPEAQRFFLAAVISDAMIGRFNAKAFAQLRPYSVLHIKDKLLQTTKDKPKLRAIFGEAVMRMAVKEIHKEYPPNKDTVKLFRLSVWFNHQNRLKAFRVFLETGKEVGAIFSGDYIAAAEHFFCPSRDKLAKELATVYAQKCLDLWPWADYYKRIYDKAIDIPFMGYKAGYYRESHIKKRRIAYLNRAVSLIHDWKFFYDMAQAQTEDWQKMVLLSAAAREAFYDKKNRKEVLKKIATEMQEMSKKHKLNVKDIDWWRSNLTTILPAKALDMLFPVDYVVYHNGDQVVFKLKSGEYSHWIRHHDYCFNVQAPRNFYVEFRDGKRFPILEAVRKRLINKEFRIFTKVDNKIKITFCK